MNKLEIKYTPVSEITPYKHNAKIHTDEQITQIKQSIENFGFNDPIAIDEDNVIIEGHGRLLAAKQLGMKEVPTIQIIGLTDQQKKAYILAHNQLTLNTGFDIDILNDELEHIIDYDMTDFGFSLDNLSLIEEINLDELIEDDVPQIPNEAKSKPGEIYILGEHRLMCGDSADEAQIQKLMNNQITDLLFIDPPYNNDNDLAENTGKRIENNNSMNDDDFESFLISALTNAYNTMKPGAAYYVWSSNVIIDQFIRCLKKVDLNYHQLLIWVKNRIGFSHADYKWMQEPCLYGWKSGAAHYFIAEYNNPTVIEDKLDISKLKKEEMQELLEAFFYGSFNTTTLHVNREKNDLHPTMKPIRLCADLIHNSSKPHELVLDLFGGSGSTLIACEQIGRRCYMMECNPKYVDVIIERWERLTGRKAAREE